MRRGYVKGELTVPNIQIGEVLSWAPAQMSNVVVPEASAVIPGAFIIVAISVGAIPGKTHDTCVKNG